MTINFGYTTSDSRVVDKDFTVIYATNGCQIYGSNSIVAPTFILHLNANTFDFEYNYCYVPKFNRYYYIKDIVIENNNMYIFCEIDVLKSYAKYIKNLNCTILRQQYIGINEIDDTDLPLKNQKLVKCAVGSDSAFNIYSSNSDKCYMLTVNNGYQLEGE